MSNKRKYEESLTENDIYGGDVFEEIYKEFFGDSPMFNSITVTDELPNTQYDNTHLYISDDTECSDEDSIGKISVSVQTGMEILTLQHDENEARIWQELEQLREEIEKLSRNLFDVKRRLGLLRRKFLTS